MSDLRFFDLNLLVAFEALMAERNVTRAGERMRIGQPAMSHALARLRELFGDELFVRVGGVMQPTPQAIELAEPISGILTEIRQRIWADRCFRPEAAETVFHLGASDYAAAAVLPKVLNALRCSAPKVRIDVRPAAPGDAEALLASGKIDLAIGHLPPPKENHLGELLFHEEFECLYDARACGIDPPLDSLAYLRLPQIKIAFSGEPGSEIEVGSPADGRPFALVTTPHYLTTPFLLKGTAAVAVVPRQLARSCSEWSKLNVSPVPVPICGFDVSMVWHERTDRDPANRWFRQCVLENARAQTATLRQ